MFLLTGKGESWSLFIYTQISTSLLLQCLVLWDFLHIKCFWELSKGWEWDHGVQDSSKMHCKNLLHAKAPDITFLEEWDLGTDICLLVLTPKIQVSFTYKSCSSEKMGFSHLWTGCNFQTKLWMLVLIIVWYSASFSFLGCPKFRFTLMLTFKKGKVCKDWQWWSWI